MGSEAVTRHGYLALREEHGFLREGYEFLDEKRLMLAQRILGEHASYRGLRAALASAWNSALAALADALAEGGLHPLSVAPAPLALPLLAATIERSHLGVAQLHYDLAATALPSSPPQAAGARAVQQACAEAF
ncbi:MAG TPA: ATPase, partial [Gammaproteobacteria bacterium]